MLRKLVRYFLLSLVVLLAFLASALLAMRFAIHGREVRVPRLTGLTPAEAERLANAEGLVLSVETRFYTVSVPEGRIVSQSPAAETRVRRGWKVVVAESLGPQRAAIPNLIGQSEHAADINIGRRGLAIGSVGTIHLPGAHPGTVVAQIPPPDAKDASSPKVGLVLAAADNAQHYVMPNFVGKPVAESVSAVEKAGFTVGRVQTVDASAPSGTVVKQRPAAGQKVAAQATIDFEVQR
jgi:eukaryotic-like serine/threonine-protein kinase